MRLIDEAFLECPFYGARQMARHLRRQGHTVGRKRVRRLMAKMGLAPIYQKPRTSVPHPRHPVHPYLLKGLVIDRPSPVWCADITYIPMRRGFLYLVAIMDWATRKVLAWRVSNTMDGQRLHRTPVALDEIRVRLPACFRDGIGPACRGGPLDRPLQRPAAPLGSGWTHARRGVSSNRAVTMAGACPGHGDHQRTGGMILNRGIA